MHFLPAKRRHSRTFCCNGCGAELVVRKGSPAPQCCGPAFLQEVHARAMMVQVRPGGFCWELGGGWWVGVHMCSGACTVPVRSQAAVLPALAGCLQNQVLYLSHEPSVAGAGAHLGEPTIAVHVSDGLCGSAHVGDRLLILGVGRHVLSLDAASAIYGCRPVLQVGAMHHGGHVNGSA